MKKFIPLLLGVSLFLFMAPKMGEVIETDPVEKTQGRSVIRGDIKVSLFSPGYVLLEWDGNELVAEYPKAQDSTRFKPGRARSVSLNATVASNKKVIEGIEGMQYDHACFASNQSHTFVRDGQTYITGKNNKGQPCETTL